MIFTSLITGIAVSLLWLVTYQWRKRRWLTVVKRLRHDNQESFYGLVRKQQRLSSTERRLDAEMAENSRLRAVIRELRRHKRFIES